MFLFWRIRYLDTRDKQFKDRDLWLKTDELDPVIKAAVEMSHELKDSGNRRDMLRYRHLFQEKTSETDLNKLCYQNGGMSSFALPDYFEDENGEELTNERMGTILTSRPDAIMFPAGTPQHIIDYVFADKPPIPVDQLKLSNDDLRILGYFTRDVREMQNAAFFREKPGTLKCAGKEDPILQTAATDEEIRSFVTIFRRLYIKKEPANFLKAVAVFHKVISDHPLGRWVKGAAEEYQAKLMQKPDHVPGLICDECTFTCKRLIDVFLYTQYAHQPDALRTRQYKDCLAAVGNKEPVLTWLFLTELWACSLRIWSVGKVIAGFFDHYCQCHQISPDVLASVSRGNPGIGGLEKVQARKQRIFNQKAEELAKAIWIEKGRPEGGPMQFINQAHNQLRLVTDNIDVRTDINKQDRSSSQ